MNKDNVDLILSLKDKIPELANIVAKESGLQVVNRKSGAYVRRIPPRLTGKALNSATKFGEINHNNRGKKGVIIKPDKTEQNLVAFKSAEEFKGMKFTKPLTEKEKIQKLLNSKL